MWYSRSCGSKRSHIEVVLWWRLLLLLLLGKPQQPPRSAQDQTIPDHTPKHKREPGLVVLIIRGIPQDLRDTNGKKSGCDKEDKLTEERAKEREKHQYWCGRRKKQNSRIQILSYNNINMFASHKDPDSWPNTSTCAGLWWMIFVYQNKNERRDYKVGNCTSLSGCSCVSLVRLMFPFREQPFRKTFFGNIHVVRKKSNKKRTYLMGPVGKYTAQFM